MRRSLLALCGLACAGLMLAPRAVGSTGAESPFGFHPASVLHAGYPASGFVDAESLGVRWHRPPVYAFWFLIQPDLGEPVYDWTLHDQQYGLVPDSIRILGNLDADHPRHPHGYTLPGSYVPVDEAAYRAFVRATVERYDGDGFQDMPGLTNPILHWQVGNEPSILEAWGFAQLQRITYEAIKEACPLCTVLIGGATSFPDGYIAQFDSTYAPILYELGGDYVDAFDFHWYGTAHGDYRLIDPRVSQDVYGHIRATLASAGFAPNLPVWITEMGSYSGDPAEPWLPEQTEREQAMDYFKRFACPLARGIGKVFPAFGLMEGFIHDNGYFDHTGLIYDGDGPGDLGLGTRKLGYYTYRKMTELLEGADWATLQVLHDGTESDWLYAARVLRGGRVLHLAWWDYFDDGGYTPGDTKELFLSGLFGESATVTAVVPTAALGQDVLDYETAFAVAAYAISEGSAMIPLGVDPVVIETSGGAEPVPGSGAVLEEPVLRIVPNPARGEVRFLLPSAGSIPSRLQLFDSSGRLVRELEGSTNGSAAGPLFTWDGRTSEGMGAPAGVYIARLADRPNVTGRMIWRR